MNADSQRKAMAFLQWDVPSRKQSVPEDCVLEGKIGTIDARHIVAASVGDIASAQIDWMRGKTDLLSFPCLTREGTVSDLSLSKLADRDGARTVTVRRDALIALLTATESESVTLSVSACALFLAGRIGDRAATAWIAGIVDEED